MLLWYCLFFVFVFGVNVIVVVFVVACLLSLVVIVLLCFSFLFKYVMINGHLFDLKRVRRWYLGNHWYARMDVGMFGDGSCLYRIVALFEDLLRNCFWLPLFFIFFSFCFMIFFVFLVSWIHLIFNIKVRWAV